MTRIFLSLACLSLVVYAANLLIGLNTGDHQQAVKTYLAEVHAFRDFKAAQITKTDEQAARERLTAAKKAFEPYQRWIVLHMFVGVATGLLVILVNSIAITYFIGTSRWVKEVVDAYKLSEDFAERSYQIKRQSFRWSLAGMLTILGVVVLGMMSDPSTWVADSAPNYVTPHYIAVLFGFFLVGLSYWMQWNRIAENYAVIETIMAQVAERQQAKAAAKAEAGA